MSSNNNDVSLIRSVLNGPEHANESLVDNNDYYTVIEGDTLQGIALKTDTSVVHLKRLNKLSSYYKPIPGQLLIIHSSAETHGASASNHGKDTSTSGIPTTSSTPSTKSSWSMWSLSAISKSSSTPPPPENSTSSTTKGAEAPPPPRNTLYSFINQFTSEVVDGLRDINNTISTGGISNDSDTEVAGDIENEDPVTSEAMDRTGSLNDEMDENKMRELKLLAELEAEDDIENSDYYDEENKVNLRSPLSKFPTDILGLLPNLLKKKPAEELSVPSKIDVATVKSQVSTESLVEPSIRKQSLPDVVLLPQQGDILSTRLAEYIVEVVPLVYQIEPMYMLYSLLKHGSDFRTYYSKVVGIKPTIVVVETSDGDIFGGYASAEWIVYTDSNSRQQSFYGNGESFVFSFENAKHVETAEQEHEKSSISRVTEPCAFHHYPWTYNNDYFMWSDEDQIAMGGGGDGFAFLLSKDFSYGTSAACETFNNEPLAVRNNKHHSNKPFTIINVEVWCFEEPKTFSPSSKNRKRNLI